MCESHSLLVIVVLGHHLHPVSHQVHGVEAHTELANQVHVATLLHLLQEGCGAGRNMGARVYLRNSMFRRGEGQVLGTQAPLHAQGKTENHPCQASAPLHVVTCPCKLAHASMQAHKYNAPEVPDLAMVPRFLTSSSLVIPMPRSRMDRMRFSLSREICRSRVWRV